MEVIRRIMDREAEARLELFRTHATTADDAIWRSYGALQHCRRVGVDEAMGHLSHLRLGIDRGYFPALSHQELNRWMILIQPGHLHLFEGGGVLEKNLEERRALYLRKRLQDLGEET